MARLQVVPLASAVALSLPDGTGNNEPTATLCPTTPSPTLSGPTRLAVGGQVTVGQLTEVLDGASADITLMGLGTEPCSP